MPANEERNYCVVMEMPGLPGQDDLRDGLKKLFREVCADQATGDVREDQLVLKSPDSNGYGAAYLPCMLAEFSNIAQALACHETLHTTLIQNRITEVKVHTMSQDRCLDRTTGYLHRPG